MMQPHNPQKKTIFSLTNRSAFFQLLKNQEATAKTTEEDEEGNDVFALLLTGFDESFVVPHDPSPLGGDTRLLSSVIPIGMRSGSCLIQGSERPCHAQYLGSFSQTHTYNKHWTECGIARILRLAAGGGRETSKEGTISLETKLS